MDDEDDVDLGMIEIQIILGPSVLLKNTSPLSTHLGVGGLS
jgi:hypothetical protein